MGAKVTLNKTKVMKRINHLCEEATEVIANEMLKDSNDYARQDTGEMISSSIRASDFKEGKLIWDTPYARKVYYMGKPSKDLNPKASLQWARVATKINMKKYLRMLSKLTGGDVNAR